MSTVLNVIVYALLALVFVLAAASLVGVLTGTGFRLFNNVSSFFGRTRSEDPARPADEAESSDSQK